MAKESYDHAEIEKKAQEKWATLDLYTTDLNDNEKEPYYLLVEFPYPSGDLHTGHWYAFALPDIYARFLRMRGRNVLFPFGFDAFGLPAENAAIKNKLDPKKWTYQNMDHMREQIAQMGASYDWSKQLATCDPTYYKWTQWLFSKFFEQGLAARRMAPVKWCPHDMTVLANEQVIDGHCERCGTLVIEKNLTQWFLKITQYAERLLNDLEPLPWPREIKEAQKAWIGKSEGLLFTSPVKDTDITLETFSAHFEAFKADTFIVIAPEHPRLPELLAGLPNEQELLTAAKEMTDRRNLAGHEGIKELEGIFTGRYTVDPIGNGELPIWIANYVLADYGTGIVKCSAHDERDFAFAQKYNIPLKEVLEPLFIREIGSDAIKPELPMVERNSVVCVVKHWSEEKYLCLKWKKNDWQGFVTGGLEADEDPVVAGTREIHEETGYKNAKFIRKIGGLTHSQFYHELKEQNRFAHFQPLYYEFENDELDELSEEESAIHEVVWIKKKEMEKFLNRGNDIAYIWKKFVSPPFPWTDMKNSILTEPVEFAGRRAGDAREDIATYLEEHGLAQRKVAFKLRDWLVSRQRYWGCPIPVVYDPEGNPHLVPAEHLPWLLPEDVDFTPTGKSPLASSKELQERVVRIFGEGWIPEYDTLDTFVDSSWYYARYLDPKDEHDFSDQALMKKWLPVNRYSGGAEHTTMHLLYARFFYKVLFDLALVPTAEPFYERFNRGLILGPDGAKMSKSKGNVINPDEFVKKYGADAVRVYLAFIGPYNEVGQYPWNLDGIEAMRRFLDRVARVAERVGDEQSTPELLRALNKAAVKVAQDTEKFKFNTALSALMIALKEFEKLENVPRVAYIDFLTLLAPYAPHLTEHLYEMIEGQSVTGKESIHATLWANISVGATKDEVFTITIQVNGKRRGSIEVASEASEEKIVAAGRTIPAVAKFLEGADVRTIYVPGRIVNFVLMPPS